MSVVDRVIEFITNDLNIKISKKNKELIIDKFYPDIKDKIYWSVSIDERRIEFFYEGIISKDEYEKIKTLSPDTHIMFNSKCDDNDDEGNLSEISFKEDINKIKKLYDKGFQNSTTYFNLMPYLYECEELKP